MEGTSDPAMTMRSALAPVVAALGLAMIVAFAPAVDAADLGRGEPVVGHKRSCSYLNNIWLWGNPEDCVGDETVPACDAPAVVNAAYRFVNRAEPVYLPLELEDLSRIQELRQSLPQISPLDRRYCKASARLSNDTHTTAYYFIEEDSGFVGLSWKVYVCLIGHDRWFVYDGNCRVARPAPSQ